MVFSQHQKIYHPNQHNIFEGTNVHCSHYLNIEEIADKLKVDVEQITKDIDQGKIPYILINDIIFVSQSWLNSAHNEEIVQYRIVKMGGRNAINVANDEYSIIPYLMNMEENEEIKIEKYTVPKMEIQMKGPEKEFLDLTACFCAIYSEPKQKNLLFYTRKATHKNSTHTNAAYTTIPCTENEYKNLKNRLLTEEEDTVKEIKERSIFTFTYDIIL